MSESEEPPTKLSKMDNGDDDNTDASFDDEPVTSCMNMPEITNLPDITELPVTTELPQATVLPAIDLQEATDLPATDLSETTEAPESGITVLPAIDMPEEKVPHMPELSDLPEIVNMPDITNLPEIGLPELSSIPEVSAASENVTHISETAEISLSMEEGVPETGTTALEGDNASEMVEERLRESLGSQDSQHEEWLSEGVLTDDDFNTSAEATNPDLNTIAPNTNGISEQAEVKRENQVTKEIQPKPVERNIEDALNSLEGGLEGYEEYLVEKKDVKLEEANVETENNKEVDDGNDTDDLLRMLGGDESKTKKKLTKTVKDLRNVNSEMSSSEDEFEVQEASVKKLKQAKALIKKDPPKVVHEESDGTSDETAIMKKMLGNKRATSHAQDARARLLQTKASINILTKTKKDKIATSTPLRQPVTRSLLKPGVNAPRAAAAQPKPNYSSVQVKREPNPNTYSRVNRAPAKQPPPTSSLREREELKEDLEEEYHLNEEESDSDDDSLRRRKNSTNPEAMDEDMLSDVESHSEDGSLYDELPSSDSDDIDDWFQLDVRAEKAGDYLPLLGPNAKDVLLEEKSRVEERVANLKKSLSALTESGKKQAEQVRSATLALAELDDMLKAA